MRYALLALAILAVVAVRYTEPVNDGDLFWQMAYGRWMVEHGTLVPEHGAFSWSPTSEEVIYCAWLSEIGLYLLHRVGGLTALFALKYLVWLAVLGLAGWTAWRTGSWRSPEAWAATLLFALASYAGANLKPELFSFLLFNLVVWSYFRYRRSRTPWPLYAFPLLLLVWVNTHGAFVFGILFLLAALAGEAWERRPISPLALTVGASLLAVLATPYGAAYPLQLLRDRLLSGANRLAMETVHAWDSPFAPGQAALHFVDYGLLMAALLGWACYRRGRLEPALLTLNLAFAIPYFLHVRTTYFWPALFLYSLLHLVGQRSYPQGRAVWAAALVLVGLLGGRAVWEVWARPYAHLYPGFGVSTHSPVVEAEFVARFLPEGRLVNDYDSGGYLLWRLYPRYRVMIDPRAFPYRSWYGDYVRFARGGDPPEFLQQNPPQVAVISLAQRPLLRRFLASPAWRCAWYGPAAAVFTRLDVVVPPGSLNFAPDRFRGVRNPAAAVSLFAFAYEVGDHPTAWRVLDLMEERFPLHAFLVEGLRPVRQAFRAFQAGDYAAALRLEEEARKRGVYFDPSLLARLYRWKYEQLVVAGRIREAEEYRRRFETLLVR